MLIHPTPTNFIIFPTPLLLPTKPYPLPIYKLVNTLLITTLTATLETPSAFAHYQSGIDTSYDDEISIDNSVG
jgi:hypothetical protein